MSTSAKILADHVSPEGSRLTHVEVEFWRPVLAEVNTHRTHSRSSASSRAIPVGKQLAKVIADPAWPLVWACEQRGMSGGVELAGDDLDAAQALFEHVHEVTTRSISDYLRSAALVYGSEEAAKEHVLHKSLLNRLLEPFMWHTAIMAATDEGWRNFFAHRCSLFSNKAQPEMMALADAIYDAMQASTPTLVDYGEWVTPYMRPEDEKEILAYAHSAAAPGSPGQLRELRRQISTARCARVSYLTHNGVRDIRDDLRLFDATLMAEDPQHWAPSEFIATPHDPRLLLPHLGNFDGWDQYRHLLMRRAGKL